MNYENIKDWLQDLPNWQMVQHIRGVVRDRKGKPYWLYIHEYGTGHFRLSLDAWPGLTYSAGMSAGWISVGVTQSKTSWMIYDVDPDMMEDGDYQMEVASVA